MKYGNIILFQSYGTWQADYAENGKRFALCRGCSSTKAKAYQEAKECVDYMKSKGGILCIR